jgi:superoxide reductase
MGAPGTGRDLFATVNRPANPAKLTPTEAKHVPVITAPRRVHPGKVFSMKIKVGSVTHVMNPSHWITEVVLLTMEGNPMAYLELSPLVAGPVALFHLALDEPMGFRVQERCNLHGLWEARHTITVG